MRLALVGCAITFMALAVPDIAAALAPRLVSETELPGSISQLRVTSDGMRVVVLMEWLPPDFKTQLAVLDVDSKNNVVAKGLIALDIQGGDLALTPEGRQALVSARLKTRDSQALIAVDLSNADQPKELWRRVINARNLTLAGDASAYAASEPSEDHSEQYRIKVRWLTQQRPDLVLPTGTANLLDSTGVFSQHAEFLAYPTWGSGLALYRLSNKVPVSYEQEDAFFTDRHRCIAAVLRSGHILVDDNRAPRLGVYAPQAQLPRVAKLKHGPAGYCHRLDVVSDDSTLAFDDGRGIQQVDMSRPTEPTFGSSWELPPSVYPFAVAGQVLFASGGDHNRDLQIYRLDQPIPVTVDWKALDAAYSAVMEQYAAAVKRHEYSAFVPALTKLQEAGVSRALNVPVTDISPQRAAAIFNDYGFLEGKLTIDRQWNTAEAALRRALELDPQRMLAVLNLADLLRARLSTVTVPSEKQASILEVEALYNKYLSLGGKRTSEIDSFLRGATVRDRKLGDCDAIASYANSGQLQYFISTSAVDVKVGTKLMDLIFSTEGTAHVPVVYAFDSETDFPIEAPRLSASENEEDEENGSGLWTGDALGLVVYGTSAHILHYRDYRYPVRSRALSGNLSCAW